MKYKIYPTNLFKKQYKKILKQGFDNKEIEDMINRIANDVTLSKKYKKHKLKGDFLGMYEIHIKSDLLLIYFYHKNILILELIAIGSHSELFD